jgi:hypothetical protein
MTSGRLRLDVHAGPKMTLAFGALRPVIGGILGMALFVLFEGGLLPAIEVAEDIPLAFYAAVRFLAGFNARFAQDMMVGSAKQLTNVQASGETPESDRDDKPPVTAR